ncbi:MAG TPA: efflux RND transporter periplasmic adaptor subunit [Gemmataceae bacterium]|nr:efflux RND transporter periplasmic adaptor subunit [Gemmataceae bacterium]
MKKLLILLLLVAAAIVGWAYWSSHWRTGSAAEQAFTLAPVEFGALTETVSATGVLQPQEVVAVGSELSGRVLEIYPGAEVNKVVEEGAPLLKLDDRKARLDLERAQTAIQLARANVKMAEASESAADLKVQRLADLPADVGLRKELDEAKMQQKAAEAGVEAAKVKVKEAEDAERLAQYGLDLTVVRARSEQRNTDASYKKPRFTIIDRKVVRGQLIAPPASAQLFTLASDLGHMQVHAQVSENDIGTMHAGLEATFTVYAYSDGNARFEGKVSEVRPMPSNIHGAVFYETVIAVANQRDARSQEWKLRPGMTAAVDVILRRHKDAWKMPTAALSFQLDDYYQTEEARTKLAAWQRRKDSDDWKPVWILNGHGKPWPVFVRIGGKSSSGETGIGDGQFNEVLEWDPELNLKPEAKASATYPQVITAAPPPPRKGLFQQQPNVRVF